MPGIGKKLRYNLSRLYDRYKEGGVPKAAEGVKIGAGQTRNFIVQLPGLFVNSFRGSTVIWERDWDICCILDGCRVDTFEHVYDGEVERIRSVASTSQTWLPRTFSSTDVSSVGYITGNPYATNLAPDEFAYFHLEPVQHTEFGIETVPPDSLVNRAIHVWRNREKFGVEQIIVHFMQPHVPFRSNPELFTRFEDEWGSQIWKLLGSDEISRDEFFDAYRDNLNWVLDDGIAPLSRNCDATIALTADHGNAAGEWGYYGHPRHSPVWSVRQVPWAIIEGVDDKQRHPDLDHSRYDINRGRQLEALGYR